MLFIDEHSLEQLPPRHVATHLLIAFDSIDRLCGLGEEQLGRELNNLHEAMDRDYISIDSEFEEDAYLRHISDEYIDVSETLPCIYWYSQFLIAYSLFEKSLNSLANSFHYKTGTQIKYTDMGGQGIERTKNYLSKVCNVDAPFRSSDWQTIKLLAEIRNAIAHKSGYISRTPSVRGSLYYRLEREGIELNCDYSGSYEAQIVLTANHVKGFVRVFRVMIAMIGGLDREFKTPKHGLPSGGESERNW